MSYESITSSVFTNLRSRLRDLPSRLTSPLKSVFGRRAEEQTTAPEAAISSEAKARAAARIETFTQENATLFDRLDRWNEREQRLRDEGTPSESAANRANRARTEILDSSTGFRQELVSEHGEDGGRAFDAELRRKHPTLFED